MAKRFISGRLKMDVAWNDRTDQYRVKICPTVKGERCEIVYVRNPSGGARSAHDRRIAVDDPRAMRDAASAAISFARPDISEYAEYNRRMTGVIVRPPRRKKRKG
jgi:hypothetical protein